MPTPLFNSVTGTQAAQKAVEARKENRKTTRWLAKLGFKQAEAAKLFDLLQTAVATPIGTFLAGWFLIDVLDRLGYFNKNTTNGKQSSQQQQAQQALQQIASGSISGILTKLATNGLFTITSPTGQSADADLLKAGIFSIAMVQAVGGGSGLNSLIAPLLTSAAKV